MVPPRESRRCFSSTEPRIFSWSSTNRCSFRRTVFSECSSPVISDSRSLIRAADIGRSSDASSFSIRISSGISSIFRKERSSV